MTLTSLRRGNAGWFTIKLAVAIISLAMKILALSGSLRQSSINTALLKAAARLAPAEMKIIVYSGLGELALFNPDNEQNPPDRVKHFHSQVATTDGIIIASPEYAHGVTGTIKNALDWLVGFEAFAYKPVAVFNTSIRAYHAEEAIRETLRTMSATLLESNDFAIPLLTGTDEQTIITTPATAASIQGALMSLYDLMLNYTNT
ncbi:MAG: NADPH-dependent FMN reductase [Methylococcaceae bacterium]|jgi:NAD(P)H-dependent FMN reductase